MKKLIINTMTVLAIAASTASAKMYYFKDLAADFSAQPKVTKGITKGGTQYVDYGIEYSDGSFSIIKYNEPVGSISSHQKHQFDYATEDAGDPIKVMSGTNTFKGYPTFWLKYIGKLKDGRPCLMVKCWIYTEHHLYMIIIATKPENMVITDRYMFDFVSSLELKTAVAPEVRPATPVRNSDTEGEI